MLHNIFNHSVFIKKINNLDQFEKHRNTFTNQIVNMANHLATHTDNVNLASDVETRGKLTTTVGRHNGVWLILDLPAFKLLEKVLLPSVIEARDSIFKNAAATNLKLSRAWNNVNYKNSYTVSHNHNVLDTNMLACIFYLEAPEYSGKFAIINEPLNDKTINLSCTDFDQTKVHYINVEANMLICHAGDVTHAVSEHLSDQRRTCVIFEYILE